MLSSSIKKLDYEDSSETEESDSDSESYYSREGWSSQIVLNDTSYTCYSEIFKNRQQGHMACAYKMCSYFIKIAEKIKEKIIVPFIFNGKGRNIFLLSYTPPKYESLKVGSYKVKDISHEKLYKFNKTLILNYSIFSSDITSDIEEIYFNNDVSKIMHIVDNLPRTIKIIHFMYCSDYNSTLEITNLPFSIEKILLPHGIVIKKIPVGCKIIHIY